jgi:predicted AAA+ superfamily ATPase
MALSNRERVGRAFELLAHGLGPYVDKMMGEASRSGSAWTREFPRDASLDDPAFQLRVMADRWDDAFRGELTRTDRNLVFELRDVRNKWAHNQPFSADDTYRALDSIERLLAAANAAEAADVGRSKEEQMRLRYEAEARRATPRPETLVGEATAGLVPWREVVHPHDDVAAGRFALAEFAADLYQVRQGEGRAEYVDPEEFFRRTYLTDGLRRLLTEAVERVTGSGGAPVVDLQTNFGGGKTHSMIALYHLFSGLRVTRFPQDVQDMLAAAGASELPSVKRVVLVGNQLQPGQPETKSDGTTVQTMWGELAWQLGEADAFALLAEADRTSTSPGATLRDLLREYAPCLILIDEWVAYARQLYADETLPAGTFDTHFSFAQALTEAARTVDGALLVVSIPASEPGRGEIGSDIEVGGAGGREALRRLRAIVGRMESSWRPASAEESFEIVRRRLFQPIDASALPGRDATCLAFGEFYRANAAEFPVECRNPAYVERMKAAYPIHPELFDRLYEDWSALERFQRTRGVLRLMAQAIHALWAHGDQSPLILPGSLPLDDAAVASELDRNLDDNWKPIIDTDIDGPGSLPRALDDEFRNLGRYGAARRVARAVFLGSAPRVGSPHRGLEVERVRLGCASPGQAVAVYGDALNRLSDRSTFLYVENARYWYGTRPGVARLARERADRYLASDRDAIAAAIVERLQLVRREAGHFAGVHVAPSSSADIEDSDEARLVILGPEAPHVARSEESQALQRAHSFLEGRGNSPRTHRNMLVFLAADHRRLEDLEQVMAEQLAWQSIDAEGTELDLSAQQAAQAKSKLAEAERAVSLRLADTYQWLLVPGQPDPTGPIEWDAIKVDGQAGLAVRAGEKLVNEGRLYTSFVPVLLRMRLDGVLAPLWESGHVSVNELWSAFSRYLYLPRLRDIGVLLDNVRAGANSTVWEAEGFGVAEAYDDEQGRYLGLTVRGFHPEVTGATLVVRPSEANAQAQADRQATAEDEEEGKGVEDEQTEDGRVVDGKLRRFYGAVQLDPSRLNRDFGRVAQEVIAHLTSLVDAQVEISVEVRAEHKDGFPEETVRTVSENAKTLKFEPQGFEPE